MKKILQQFRNAFKKLTGHRRARVLLYVACVGTIIFLVFIISCRVSSPLPPQDYAPAFYTSEGRLAGAYLSRSDKWRLKGELEEISPLLIRSFMEKEDRYFYYHPGINPMAVCRAAYNNLVTNRRTSGASTITMQTVRLLHPRPRTFGNKIKEAYRALQLEWMLSKDEILMLYLNSVPYGGNVEGVKSAALLYFGRAPDRLSAAQCALLTIIPNRPTSLKPGKDNDLLLQTRNSRLRQYAAAGLLNAATLRDALDEPLGIERRALPAIAPHLCRRLLPEARRIHNMHLTLRSEVQATVTELTRNYAAALKQKGIGNAAVLVVDNRTREAVAYVGSDDFYDYDHSGQVDGIKALRSPGSTLKPLLYAAAFDAGLITPKTVVNDVECSFNGYEPSNFDGIFHGPVTVESALSASLNIPAVKVLDELGVKKFIKLLAGHGFAHIKANAAKLGHSIILGGCGADAEELTGAYSALASGGIFMPVSYVKNRQRAGEKRVFSQEAAFVVSEILTSMKRPDLPHKYENSMHLPKIAWKTGTSYGRRDAWSIGYNSRYTVTVWCGNFSGKGVPELTGADIATPLLFEIFNRIDYNSREPGFKMPRNLQRRTVCTHTGLLPSAYCKSLAYDVYLPGVSSSHTCSLNKIVFISPDSAFSYKADCLPGANEYVKAVYPVYPPELTSYYLKEGIPFVQPPPLHKNCERGAEGEAPRITSPRNGAEYLLETGQKKKIMLKAQLTSDAGGAHWYINDIPYGRTLPGKQLFFEPAAPGDYKVSCSDDKGRFTDVYFLVKFY